MTNRIAIIDGSPRLVSKANGHSRTAVLTKSPLQELQERRIAATYDSARSGTDLDPHWAHADARDSDSANNPTVRRNLRNRSRYETGSNGYYTGILNNQVVLGIGLGPSLRMLTGNRGFNQTVEKAWFAWTQKTRLAQKLRCMAHARAQDGEAFALLVNNPAIEGDVQLDVMLIEADQVTTPYLPMERGYIDGIRLDEFDNVKWYDILPEHPGSDRAYLNLEPIQVPSSEVLHWFKLKRPSAHRGVPDLTSTLNVGATNRRMREATVTSVESAASIGALISSQLSPAGSDEADPVAPFKTFEIPRRTGMTLPMGWEADQLAAAHPNAQYGEFHRQQLSEMASPIGQPYNVAAHDSSTYSFASGKLDTLIHWAGIDIDRQDCDILVLDKIFAAWFREWTISTRQVFTPNHQWDWPVKPVIDAVAEANATDTKLKNGSIQLRQVYSDQGQDLEDQLVIMAEDRFGDSSEESIIKCRKILALINTPQHAIPYVAELLGVTISVTPANQPQSDVSAVQQRVRAMEDRITSLESHQR